MPSSIRESAPDNSLALQIPSKSLSSSKVLSLDEKIQKLTRIVHGSDVDSPKKLQRKLLAAQILKSPPQQEKNSQELICNALSNLLKEKEDSSFNVAFANNQEQLKPEGVQALIRSLSEQLLAAQNNQKFLIKEITGQSNDELKELPHAVAQIFDDNSSRLFELAEKIGQIRAELEALGTKSLKAYPPVMGVPDDWSKQNISTVKTKAEKRINTLNTSGVTKQHKTKKIIKREIKQTIERAPEPNKTFFSKSMELFSISNAAKALTMYCLRYTAAAAWATIAEAGKSGVSHGQVGLLAGCTFLWGAFTVGSAFAAHKTASPAIPPQIEKVTIRQEIVEDPDGMAIDNEDNFSPKNQ